MKTISVNVEESAYNELKSLAEEHDLPVGHLIREAMAIYVKREKRNSTSFADLKPLDAGRQLITWKREDLLDEMREHL